MKINTSIQLRIILHCANSLEQRNYASYFKPWNPSKKQSKNCKNLMPPQDQNKKSDFSGDSTMHIRSNISALGPPWGYLQNTPFRIRKVFINLNNTITTIPNGNMVIYS